jgi:hypothetical protein
MTTSTVQFIAIDSKEGKAFLRKVARSWHEWRQEWHFRASAETDWKVTFTRTVKGEIGEPDAYVTVETDAVVGRRGNTGLVKSFHDSDEVVVPAATVARLSGADARTAATLLLDGWRFEVSQSAGSTSSSKHGLAFLSLHVERRGSKAKDNWDSLEIGCASVLVNGQFVVRGAVE